MVLAVETLPKQLVAFFLGYMIKEVEAVS